MERPNTAEESAYDDFIEQLIEQNHELLERQSASKATTSEYPTVYIPDYSKELLQIYEQLGRFNRNYQKDNIAALFEQMDRKIAAMPQVIPVKHHHHFDPKSKWIIVVYFVLIIAVAILTGTTIGFATESYLLKRQVPGKQLLLNKQTGDTAKIEQKSRQVRGTTKKGSRHIKSGRKQSNY